LVAVGRSNGSWRGSFRTDCPGGLDPA
jgi:hypothetical protein